jgi:hypothetical protein
MESAVPEHSNYLPSDMVSYPRRPESCANITSLVVNKYLQEEAERISLLNLPPATPEQLKYLTNFLQEEAKRHGLSDTDIHTRQNITAVLGKALAEIMPGMHH